MHFEAQKIFSMLKKTAQSNFYSSVNITLSDVIVNFFYFIEQDPHPTQG